MLYLRIRLLVFTAILMVLFTGFVFPDDPVVSIYRDFDDGLFGRSIYRGVIFSVKIDSFKRYEPLSVKDMDGPGNNDGLTAYLVSRERAEDFAAGRGDGVTSNCPTSESPPESCLYSYKKSGISIVFSLEKPPESFFDEIQRTYSGRFSRSESVIKVVTASYENGYIIRIHQAENVYRPHFATLDYEDVLVSAALIGDSFQPLWGIHDGNDITASHLALSSSQL